MPVPHSLFARPLRVVRNVNEFARARLPSRHGDFEIVSFIDDVGRTLDDVAIVRGDVRDREEVPTRVHSECLTGDVFGSFRCDCRDQLELALDRIQAGGLGVILYLRQEGRGIGLTNKIRAYALQSQGVDTVDANRQLGLPDDSRRYESAAAMLEHLGVRSVRLLTNNPEKVAALRSLGVAVRGQVPVLIEPNVHSRGYLRTKVVRMNHSLPQVAGAYTDAE